MTYLAGERCLYEGKLFEARFDLCRGLKPAGPHSQKFWRPLPRILPAAARKSDGARQMRSHDAARQILEVVREHDRKRRAPTGYLTRDMQS
ncbi:hypothetical protein [Mesorhizobium sp.]|uniref:hypothetical protein n=1 Tax=Mesorhizobium sp. TaxID=1871066 RepID=UPI000FE45B42|nr:hypothetical protein [Mesorhizobium sp.]RWG07356.1 MAG: hypothetical protein EOQ54_04485 [Mesorhizobium sp.]RWH03729.1 MAG: hypothetical protein EOQ72_01600 [Mesorhizobium sp.]TIN42103.1 MAG: hypothetical protein E5Y25_17655 [Mesorhizobium sp.]TIR93802.1 MAG: hypothetical protein E5X08_08385 [Mesorhizobium sp.]TIS00061.1 MAG: hypothetical protein E5X13_19370 [Mesorhizobium sp.]